jgi:nucleoside-diphosphate-sugar epimerase
MKVLVTGASGFVGSHTVAALLADGYDVRATARDAGRVRRALAGLGCADEVEVAEADALDEGALGRAAAGCEAAIHAAAAYTHDVRQARRVLALNPRATENLLRVAARHGLERVVHVSSYVALLPSAAPLRPDSPVGSPPTAYARSKAAADAIARRAQERREPVTIVYPGMVWGPQDPGLGESSRLARDVARGLVPFGVPGAVPLVDVRDLARVHVGCLRRDGGPRRYLATGERVALRQLVASLSELVGRRAPIGTLPPRAFLAAGRAMDALQRISPWRLPLDGQAPWTVLNTPACDASATESELGWRTRPAERTLADTVSSLRERGLV